MRADAFADFRVGYDGLCLRDKFDGEFSDDDDVSSTVSVEKVSDLSKKFFEKPQKFKPLCVLYFDCFRDFAEHSLSLSDPSVSYSVMGM